MKKLLVLVGLLTSMYAIPPCELQKQDVCGYLYKGAMSAEIILVNLSPKKIIIKEVSAELDGMNKTLSDIELRSGESLTLLKSKYEDHSQKPKFWVSGFTYTSY